MSGQAFHSGMAGKDRENRDKYPMSGAQDIKPASHRPIADFAASRNAPHLDTKVTLLQAEP